MKSHVWVERGGGGCWRSCALAAAAARYAATRSGARPAASWCGGGRSRWRSSALYLARRRCSTRSPGSTRARRRRTCAEPRSLLIDRPFPADFQERSYSAPLADVEFYGGAPLRIPGGHLLGTDILGRDVLLQALEGARVALLIGGLTSLIAIPLALLFGVAAGYRGGWLDDVVFFVMSTLLPRCRACCC